MNKLLFGAVAVIVLFFIFYGRGGGEPVAGSLTIKGSDTEVQVVSNMVEAFIEANPDADISVTGGGSGVGIAALLNGEIDIANASRRIKDTEIDEAESKGITPHEFIIARDGLSVIVHPDNPVAELSLEQIGALYRGEITNWSDVGGNDLPVVLYGRQNTSGTYEFFREFVLKADYASTMRNMEGNQAIVDAVTSDVNGIGYVGIGYVMTDTKEPRSDIAVVAVSAGGPAYSPLNDPTDYPLSRPLYQYLDRIPEPGSLMDSLLRYEVSEAGQEIVIETGFFPLSAEDKAVNDTLFERIGS
jgi:phosphate transport system substrate-binding protein